MILVHDLNFNTRISGNVYAKPLTSTCFSPRSIRSYAMWVTLFFDEADVAAPFHTRDSNIEEIVCVCAEAHVFVQIMR
jgi:hypothetical protein